MRLKNIGLSALAASTLFLSGCSSVFSDLKEAWHYATNTPADVELSTEELEAFPYTALYARRADQPRALIVLGFVDGEGQNSRFQWVSAQREVLETRAGRMVRTDKFEPDLLSMSNLGSDPLLCIQEQLRMQGLSADFNACDLTWGTTLETLEQGQRSTFAVNSEFRLQGTEAVALANGQRENTVKISEHMVTQPPRGRQAHKYENHYWLGEDGLIVKSYQHFVPGEPGVSLEVAKWVGRDE